MSSLAGNWKGLNIVDDLEALLDRLAKEGVQIDPKRQDESYGRFARMCA